MSYTPYLPEFTKKITGLAEQRARRNIRSKQLRRGLYKTEVAKGPEGYGAAIVIPHFWAVILHDGREQVRGDPLLIWFRDRRKDPRLLNGNTPERLSQTRRLTKEEFNYWMGVNRQIIKDYRKQTGKQVLTSSDYEAMKLPMVVARVSPRSGRRVEGEYFFSNDPGGGMYGFMQEVDEEAVRGTSEHVKKELAKIKLLNGKRTVTVGL